MNRLRILILSIALVVLGFAWTGVTPVQAHAMLVRSIPEANATLANSPAKVDLYFSEGIDPNFSTLSVLDMNGNRVDAKDAKVDPSDPTHLSVDLPSLGNGVFTVVWKVISATDGHQTNGSFPFGVGTVNQGALTSATLPSTGSSIPLADVLTKGILYITAAAIMGAILFTFLVWNLSVHSPETSNVVFDQYNTFSRQLILWSLIIFVTAEILNLLAQAGQDSGAVFALPWQATFLTVLIDTRIGVIGISRFALVFIISGLLLPRQNRWNRWASLPFSLLFLLTFSLESHAASELTPILPVLADWIHMTAVSVWVGGLFSFLGVMWLIRRIDARTRTLLTARLIPHFSNLAMTSVGILAITGPFLALLHIGSFQDLISTTYGQAFILKGVIGFGMVGLGGYNFLVTTPRMKKAASQPDGSPQMVSRFSKLLMTEVTLGLLILVWVSVFTSLSPAKISPVSSGFTQTTQVDDLTITLKVDPNKPGTNTFTAIVKSGSSLVTTAKSVSLEFNPVSGMVPASKAAMTNNQDGTYTLNGGYLGMPDQWDIKVVVVRLSKYDAYADFKVNNVPPIIQPIPWRTMAAVMITLTGIGYAFSFRMLDFNIKRWLGLGVVPAIALGAVSLVVGLM